MTACIIGQSHRLSQSICDCLHVADANAITFHWKHNTMTSLPCFDNRHDTPSLKSHVADIRIVGLPLARAECVTSTWLIRTGVGVGRGIHNARPSRLLRRQAFRAVHGGLGLYVLRRTYPSSSRNCDLLLSRETRLYWSRWSKLVLRTAIFNLRPFFSNYELYDCCDSTMATPSSRKCTTY